MTSHSPAGQDPRDQVVGKDALGAFALPVDGEGDALVQKGEVGRRLPLPHLVRVEQPEPLEERRVVRTRAARRDRTSRRSRRRECSCRSGPARQNRRTGEPEAADISTDSLACDAVTVKRGCAPPADATAPWLPALDWREVVSSADQGGSTWPAQPSLPSVAASRRPDRARDAQQRPPSAAAKAMADAANAFLGDLERRAEIQGDLQVRGRFALRVPLHAARPHRPAAQGDERGAAQQGARAAQDRPEHARLHHRDDDHRPRERAQGDRAAAHRAERHRPRPRAVLRVDLRHARARVHGAGSSKAITSRSTSRSSTTSRSCSRRRSSDRTRRSSGTARSRARARCATKRKPAARC